MLTSWIKTPLSFEAKVGVVIATASVLAGFLVNPVPSTVVSVFRTYTACVGYMLKKRIDIALILPNLFTSMLKVKFFYPQRKSGS